jgi:putative flippase GtrA
VTLDRKLYRQFRQIIHEGAKFLVVGGIAFVVNTVGTNLLHFQVGLGPVTSNVVATVVATFVAYAGNRWWTFQSREGTSIVREYVLFFVLNGIGLFIQLACIVAAYYILGMHGRLAYNIALIFGITLGTFFRFWSYRKWVWVSPPAGVAPALAADVPRESLPAAYLGAEAAPPVHRANGHRVRQPGRHAARRS